MRWPKGPSRGALGLFDERLVGQAAHAQVQCRVAGRAQLRHQHLQEVVEVGGQGGQRGAADLLESAIEHPSLDQSVQGCSLALGLTSRDREFGPPAIDWQSALDLISENTQNQGKTALVFGPERTGLENHHLSLCTHRVWLDANPDYPSLNLAQALMVCAYTVRQALQKTMFSEVAKGDDSSLEFADPAAVTAMLEHWRAGLEAIGYLDPANPKKLMPRLEALFARSRLRKEEIDLLRGISKQMLLRK